MQIYEYLSKTDLPTYQRIIKLYNFNPEKPIKHKAERKRKTKKNDIELGDSIEHLMSHRAYKRVRGALRQIRWNK